MTETARRPLGVLPTVELSADQLGALTNLENFDLEPVRRRLIKEAAMPSSWIDEAITEFRRYLGLAAVMHGPLPMMNGPIDKVWHTCLLFSQLYADLCEQSFGRFVHHEPAEEEDSDPDGSWATFQLAYERVYGELGQAWLRGVRSQ